MNLKPFAPLLKLLQYIWFETRIYGLWSRIYRFLFERDLANINLNTYVSYRELASFIRGKYTYQKDGFRQLKDAISYPGRIEVEGVGDCDDISIYLVHVIDESSHFPGWEEDPVLTSLMSITYIKDDGTAGGHNVCLLARPSEDGVTYGYMDYRLPTFGWEGPQGIKEMARYIARRNGGPNAVPLVLAIHDKDLALLTVAML